MILKNRLGFIHQLLPQITKILGPLACTCQLGYGELISEVEDHCQRTHLAPEVSTDFRKILYDLLLPSLYRWHRHSAPGFSTVLPGADMRL